MDEIGGLNYGSKNNDDKSITTTVSRRDFIFFLLSKFKLSDDIKDMIDKICLLAMDIEYLEKSKATKIQDIFYDEKWVSLCILTFLFSITGLCNFYFLKKE